MKASPFQLGMAAHERGVEIAAHDEELIEWLKQNTSGEAGSAIPHLKDWQRGFNSAVDAECEKILSSH
ncbi:hypothetical protein [Vibrio cholerae]|uniref:hypothetical protein n=1 Tax=Vibrio cholerae TaxID=666 RepID=UPI0029E9B60B|nr:hypothetical protein [Vibrio cholerae]